MTGTCTISIITIAIVEEHPLHQGIYLLSVFVQHLVQQGMVCDYGPEAQLL